MDRFWNKVEKAPGCWLWTGASDAAGYGYFRTGGRGSPTTTAHRVAYELTFGPVPDGHVVCHKCDNRPCVRPDHLFAGPQSMNIEDMVAKNRHARGRVIARKLTAQDVHDMRDLYSSGGVSKAEIARRFGVSPTWAGKVLAGEWWRHVPS